MSHFDGTSQNYNALDDEDQMDYKLQRVNNSLITSWSSLLIRTYLPAAVMTLIRSMWSLIIKNSSRNIYLSGSTSINRTTKNINSHTLHVQLYQADCVCEIYLTTM